MKRQTVLVLTVIAVLLISAAVYSRRQGGGVLAKWISAHRANAGQ